MLVALAALCSGLVAISCYKVAVDHRSALLAWPSAAGLLATGGAWRANRRV
jgi:hypothetical protein